MDVPQLSVFVENKPGHLENVLNLLGEEKINIITLTIAETSDFGILRLVVNNPVKGKEILTNNNITCTITEVIAIKMDDDPGSLYEHIEIFSSLNLSIEYMYTFSEKIDNKTVMIFRFNDAADVKSSLIEAGCSIVDKTSIIREE